MGNERLTLEIAAKAIGQDSIDRLSESLNRFSEAAESAGGRSAKGIAAIQPAAEASSGSLRRLFLAAKDLGEGRNSFATVEAGYFIQSLGGVQGAAVGAAAAIALLAVGLSKVNEIVRDGGPKMANAFDGLNSSIRTANDELRVTGDRLRNEIAKLEGKPQNMLALSLDEDRVAADNLASSIHKAIDALLELEKTQGIGHLNAFFTRRSSTASDESEIKEFSRKLADVDRRGLAGVRGATTDDARKSWQASWNTEADRLLTDEEGKFSRLAEQSELIEKYRKNPPTATELKQYNARFGPLETGQDESARLEERRGMLGDLQEIHDKYRITSSSDDAERQRNSLQGAHDLAEAGKRASTAVTERLHKAAQDTMAAQEADHKVSLPEKIETSESLQRISHRIASEDPDRPGRTPEELGNVEREREITVELGKLYQERNDKLGELIRRGAEIEKEETRKKDEWMKRNIDLSYSIGLDFDNDQTRKNEDWLKTRNTETRGTEDAALSDLNRDRLSASRAATLTPIGASDSIKVAARLAELDKIKQIDIQERDVQLAEQQQIIDDTARLYAKDTDQYQAAVNKKTEIQRAADQKIYDDQTKSLEAMHAEREKELADFKSQVGGAFDALASHSLPQYLKGQVLGLGRTITENAAAMALPAIEKVIPHTSGTLGKLLSGTPFGPDPLKTAGLTLNTAGDKLIEAAAALTGRTPGSGIPGAAGGINTSDPSGLGAIINGTAGNPYTMANPGDPGTVDAGWEQLPIINHASYSNSGFGFNGSTIAKAAGIGLEGYQAFKGFEKGGAGGALEGTSGVLGGAAGIAAMVPGGQAVAAGLAIASAVTGLVGSFLDGATRRANAISTELGQAQYVAPTALNVTQSSGGTFADFDAKGNLRTSNFSPYPQVSQGSVWEQTHGLFGGPPTFYQVPGGQKSQFGGPIAPPAPPAPVEIHIHAIDTQTGIDFLLKNHMAVGNAAAKALQNAHGPLSAEVQRAANP